MGEEKVKRRKIRALCNVDFDMHISHESLTLNGQLDK